MYVAHIIQTDYHDESYGTPSFIVCPYKATLEQRLLSLGYVKQIDAKHYQYNKFVLRGYHSEWVASIHSATTI